MAQALTTSGALVTNPSNALPKSAVDLDVLSTDLLQHGSVASPVAPVALAVVANNTGKIAQPASYKKAQAAALQNSSGAPALVVRDQQGNVIGTQNPLSASLGSLLPSSQNVQVAQVKAPQYNYVWLLVLLVLIILIIAFIVSYKNQSYGYYGAYRM